MEQVVGGEWQHGSVVATTSSGQRYFGCRCRAVVHEYNWRSHIAQHRRESVVWRASMDMNSRGVDFQEGQQWVMKPGPRRRAATSRRTSSKRTKK